MTQYKGDNTGAFGQKWLRGRINLPDEISYEKIAVQIGGLEPKIIETAEREFYIILTGEETAKLDYSNDVFCAIFDTHGQKKTLKGTWNFIAHREVVHEADAPDGTQPTTGILQNDVAFDWESEDYFIDFVLEYTPSKLSQLQDDIGVAETKEALANEIERSTNEDIAIRANVTELYSMVDEVAEDLDAEIEARQEKDINLQSQIDAKANQSSLDETNNNLNITNNNLDALTGDVENIAGDVENITGRVGELESDVQSIADELDTKQAELVSGVNIKTINNQSILGAGNIVIQGGGGGASSFSELEGSPYDNTALAQALNEKATPADIQTHNTSTDAHSDIRAGIDALDNRIDEIELFKFPNAIIIGEPTIQNGQIKDFSTVSYLQFPFVFDFSDRAFQVDFCFTTAQNVQTQQNILDSNFGIALAIQNGKGVMAISSNGTSWDIGVAIGNVNIQSNTTYFARLICNNLKYKTNLSMDGINYTDDMVIVNTKRPFPTTVFIGGCSQTETGHEPHPFLGSINLNKAYLYVNNQLIWQGMDDAGLATRADVSLSNLDAEGEARFDAKQDVIEDIDTIRDLAKGAQQGVSFTNYQAMVTNLNAYEYDKFIIGQSIYIATKDVPDVWVYAKYQESQQYTYTTDDAIVSALKAGTLRIGRFEISALETGKVDIDGVIKGVQVNGTDLTPDANSKVSLPICNTTSKLGLVQTGGTGVGVTASGLMYTTEASDSQLQQKTNQYNVVTSRKVDMAVKVGLTTNTLTLSDTEQRTAQSWLGTTDMEIEFSDGSESTFSIVGKI